MRNGKYVDASGIIEWYENDQLHKIDGPAFVSGESKLWYEHGKLHREDGPAIITSHRNQAWYKHGKQHREDGPAVIHSNGNKEWFINGNQLTQEEFNQWLDKKNLNEKLHSTLAPSPTIKRGKI